jgi:hypothetical protein
MLSRKRHETRVGANGMSTSITKTTHASRARDRLKREGIRGMLRIVMVARVLISFSVAWMLAGATPTFVGLGVPFMIFGFADGTLAIVMASLAFNTRLLRGKFVAAALFDGLVLLGASMTLLGGTRVPGTSQILALHVGIAATCLSLVGVVRLLVARRVYPQLVGHALSTGLVIAALASAALGIAELFTPPNAALAKRLLMTALVLQGVALLLPAVRTWPPSGASSRADTA